MVENDCYVISILCGFDASMFQRFEKNNIKITQLILKNYL